MNKGAMDFFKTNNVNSYLLAQSKAHSTLFFVVLFCFLGIFKGYRTAPARFVDRCT